MIELGIIGSGSMVGSRFCELSKTNLKLIEGDFPQLDITSKESTENFFKNQFEWAILFSAFTDVDAAENQRGDKNGSCWKINVDGVKNVVEECIKNNRKLIFISTETVFDGQNGPYDENDPTSNESEVSWYGYTKIEGEQIVKSLPHFIIVRICYPYRGPFAEKKDMAKKILEKYKNRELYPLYTDQIWTPTFIDDVSPAISLLLDTKSTGIYHVASPMITTPFDFAQRLLEKFEGTSEGIQKGSLKDVIQSDEKSTKRPIKGGLKVEKITRLGFTPTTWEQGIEEIYNQSNGKLI